MTDELKPDPRNARDHPERNQELIRQSLEEVGGFRSIAVDGENVIRAGNGVYEQALALGLKVRVVDAEGDELIAVRRKDLTGDKAERAAILDNYTGETSGWKPDVLKWLKENNPQAIEGTFTPEEWTKLMQKGRQNGGRGDGEKIGKAEKVQEKWKVQSGDLWFIPSSEAGGEHRLVCGDSTDPAVVEFLFGDQEPAIMFATDAPYGIDYLKDSANSSALKGLWEDIENDDLHDEDLQTFLEAVYNAWVPHLAPSAAWYMWHAHSQSHFFASAMKSQKVLIHRQIIWVKPQFVMGMGFYHWRHEPCYMGWVQGNRPEFYGERNQSTVWEVEYEEGRRPTEDNDKWHPTQKPAELFRIPIRNHTLLHQICAEPFAGSGSQFVAGEELGRRVFGSEIAPMYCAVVLERMERLGLKPQLESRMEPAEVIDE